MLIVSSREVRAALTNIMHWRQGATGHTAGRPELEEVCRCRAAVSALPAVRPEQVCRIKTAVDTSCYIIDDYQVATKMVERTLVDFLYATAL